MACPVSRLPLRSWRSPSYWRQGSAFRPRACRSRAKFHRGFRVLRCRRSGCGTWRALSRLPRDVFCSLMSREYPRAGPSQQSNGYRHEQPLKAMNVRPEASLIYVNSTAVLEAIKERLRRGDVSVIQLMICDLSASPFIDLAGSRMLHELHAALACRSTQLCARLSARRRTWRKDRRHQSHRDHPRPD